MILAKLAQLRGYKAERDCNINIKRVLRNRLRQTYERINYYLYYRGCRVYLGDGNTPKKQFLMILHQEKVLAEIKTHRLASKKKEVITKQKRTSNIYLNYDVIGGVMRQDRTFVKINRRVRKQKVRKFKAPRDNKNYIGVEFEFASRWPEDTIVEKIADLGLHDSVRAMFDRSIEPEGRYKNRVEVCVLSPEADIETTLDELAPLIIPENFKVNKSCGLHVHIDARNALRVKKIFSNLTAMQSVLFHLVDENRRENRYCVPVLTTDFDKIDGHDHDGHYAAISKFSYFKHRTIEVRIHHSTLDLTRVKKWIKLIQTIAAYDGPELKMGSLEEEMKQLKEQIKIAPDLENYVTGLCS
jgi:Putative amidoligase enzyme